MQSMWKGAIGFGLVSIPVKLYAATEEHGVSLHQVHAADSGRIRMKRTCEKCGKEVAYADVATGYEDEAGRITVLTDADLAELPLPSKKLIDVLAFVDAGEIDPLSFSRAYYVGADAAASKPYVLLREALIRSGKTAVTKIALRARESLALLRAHEDVLVLHTLYWPDEIRSASGLAPPENVTVRSQELKMAESLMETLSEGFDLSALHDEYQHALDELVSARLEGDLMSALQASIDAWAGEKQEEKPAPRKKAAAKKATPAMKAAERKAAAKKAPAKKATHRRTAS